MNRDSGFLKGHYLLWGTYALLVVLATILGGVVGMVFGYAVDLPRVEELEANQPSVVSYVYAEDGRVLGEFALEKRTLISYEQIPETIRQAILSAEDANFFQHSGIDFRRLLATVLNNLIRWERKGGSTLTMQLSKLRFTSTEKTYERKIKDALYAINIEKSFSKQRIFTFYCNQIYFGHGNYGIASAARYYFDNNLDELTVSESALLAGLIQSPERHSPIKNPEGARARRNWVLGRMLETGAISKEIFEEASRSPLVLGEKSHKLEPAPYFVEWVRQYLEKKYPTSQIWQRGLRIYTTLDYDMQLAAQAALRSGLREFDHKRRGWAGPVRNLLDDGESVEEYIHPDWRLLFQEGQNIHGLVLDSDDESATVRMGSYRAAVDLEDIEWTGKNRVNQVLKKGDVALFHLRQVDRQEKELEATLEQLPEAQGAVLAIENRTGAIQVMVGGYDFEYSKFNRATQALRQPGSVFKPFTYVAALEGGFYPFDQVLDSPVTFFDALGRPYEPSNSDGEFLGLITVDQALAGSRNVPTVRLANALGPEKVAEVARRFGLRGDFQPYLSLSLGAVEVTLTEMVSAFSVFPNRGVRAEPYFIKRVEDNNGLILEETRPRVHDEVLTPEVSDIMIYMLQNVVRNGTARQARRLSRPVGGKTGTTNDSTDSWFVGFTPQLTAGVWTGHDQKKSLGDSVYGATLALPIWIDFMASALEEEPVEEFDIEVPESDFYLARVIGEPEEIEALEARQEQLPLDRPSGVRVEDIEPPF